MRTTLALLFALAGAPALAAEPEAADQPVATADAQGGVADQIDGWIRSSPATEQRADAVADKDAPVIERQPHGVVSVGVGTHGYRSVYARTDLPVGKTGTLSIAVADVRGGRLGPGYGYGPGLGYAFLPAFTDRQRCDLEAMSPQRPLDVTGGPNGRCVSRLPAW